MPSTRSPRELPRAVGQRIAAVRRERGWTQEKLGERLKIAAKNVQRLERGQNLTLVTLGTVARALGVEPSRLLEPDEAEPEAGWCEEVSSLGFELGSPGSASLPVFVGLESEARGKPLGWVKRPVDFLDRGDLVLVQLPGDKGWCLLGRAEGNVAGRRLLLIERTKGRGQLISCEAERLELDAAQRPVLLARVSAFGRAVKSRNFVLGEETSVVAELVRAWPSVRGVRGGGRSE